MSAVLFLDIDGVLNSRDCWASLTGQRYKIDRTKVALLNEVVAATGCKVVVSSTWRKGAWSGPQGCRAILRYYGVRARFPRDWRTIELPGPAEGDAAAWLRWSAEHTRVRGEEIADWLSRNGSPAYAIVDDDSDMLPEQMPRFVQTSFEHGLTREHADRLIALLSPEPTTSEPTP
ncbi:HAD domain-containing protein [Methylorubrum extorquens]|uniref:Polynucleotide kinase n=1 Tax=Methylorubrum extorquens (strain CM4 / NCIMB 13688) TaxID=440085 RepID=B7KTH5_METC4|nr:HAD domain-containing protein [Methylorubrum extorquens]ACK82502.1 conserved hypothetical protein [Methylorubrum extorquens CM4]